MGEKVLLLFSCAVREKREQKNDFCTVHVLRAASGCCGQRAGMLLFALDSRKRWI